MKAGVKRFVHLSTLALYGDEVTGTIAEDTPIHPKTNWDYAQSKHAAEQIVVEAAKRGLPAIVLRVAVVYGPHNQTIVARPLQQLAHNRLVLVDCRDVPSNTIYVDNLCEAIECSLRAAASANGEMFLLSDDDGFTWGDYFGFFARALGASVQHAPKQPTAVSAADQPSMLRRWTQETKELLLSAETKALARRIYNSNPWGAPARWVVETFPNAVRRVARVIRPEEPFIYTPNVAPDGAAESFIIDPVRARVSAEKAARVLGFQPVVTRYRAMELTLAWARHARIVPTSARDEVAAGRS